MNELKPNLTEPGMRYFLNQALKHSHQIREEFYNLLFNIGIFLLFGLSVVFILTYKYKGKLSRAEMAQKNQEKYAYILEKIKQFEIAKERTRQTLITGLPYWENEYDNLYSRS